MDYKIFLGIGLLVVATAGGTFYFSKTENKQLEACLKIVEDGQIEGKRILNETKIPEIQKHIETLEAEGVKQIERCHLLFGNLKAPHSRGF